MPHRQHPRRPRGVDAFLPPVYRGLQHCDPLAPECCLPRERLPLLLPGGIGIQREDQRVDVLCSCPTAWIIPADDIRGRNI